MWQTSERLTGACGTRLDAEDHLHHVVGNLDPLDQRADDVALGGPVRRFQPIAHHGREQAQLADHQLIVSLTMRQPWGSGLAEVSVAQFVQDSDKYNIGAFGKR